ncbi:MAG: class I SAM-dependent methyltransferase [Cytophagaceae bacterium]
MAQGFESIATYYDCLVRITSGNLLYRNAISLFSEIENASSVLVIGDGSGRITEALLKHHSVEVIYYIELSPTLISKAEKRLNKLKEEHKLSTRFHFLQQDIFESELPPTTFDLILTPYVLDLWGNEKLRALIQLVSPCLKVEGSWYVSDFNPEIYHMRGMLGWLYRGLIRMLYQFFEWMVKLKTNKLPDIETCFTNSSYSLQSKKVKAGGLLVSMVYKK